MPRAKGCAAPHNRFCTASASENTSRPQPFSCDIGARKKPSADRGPNDRTAIRQPQTMITPGVRQLAREYAASRLVMGGGSQHLKIRKNTRVLGKQYSSRAREQISRLSGSADQIETSELIAVFSHGSHPKVWRMAAIRDSEIKRGRDRKAWWPKTDSITWDRIRVSNLIAVSSPGSSRRPRTVEQSGWPGYARHERD